MRRWHKVVALIGSGLASVAGAQIASPPASVSALMEGVAACTQVVSDKGIDETVLSRVDWIDPIGSSADSTLHLFLKDGVLIQTLSFDKGAHGTCVASAHLDSAARYIEVIALLRDRYGTDLKDPDGEMTWPISAAKNIRVSLDAEGTFPGVEIRVGAPIQGRPINVTTKAQ